MGRGVARVGTSKIVITIQGCIWWWGGEEWFNGDDGRGGVEGEGSSSSFRLMRDGCGYLTDDREEEVVGRNWDVGGGEEML